MKWLAAKFAPPMGLRELLEPHKAPATNMSRATMAAGVGGSTYPTLPHSTRGMPHAFLEHILFQHCPRSTSKRNLKPREPWMNCFTPAACRTHAAECGDHPDTQTPRGGPKTTGALKEPPPERARANFAAPPIARPRRLTTRPCAAPGAVSPPRAPRRLRRTCGPPAERKRR